MSVKNRSRATMNRSVIEAMEGRVFLSASVMHHDHDGPGHDRNDDKAVHVNAKHDKVDNDKNDVNHDKNDVRHSGKDDAAGHH